MFGRHREDTGREDRRREAGTGRGTDTARGRVAGRTSSGSGVPTLRKERGREARGRHAGRVFAAVSRPVRGCARSGGVEHPASTRDAVRARGASWRVGDFRAV